MLTGKRDSSHSRKNADAGAEIDKKGIDEYNKDAEEALECILVALSPSVADNNNSASSANSAVAIVQLMDYVDEVFTLIAGEVGSSSPETMATFVEDCF